MAKNKNQSTTKRKIAWKKLLIAVIIIAILGGIGYYAYGVRMRNKAMDTVSKFLYATMTLDLDTAAEYCDDEITDSFFESGLTYDFYDLMEMLNEKHQLEETEYSDELQEKIENFQLDLEADYIKKYTLTKVMRGEDSHSWLVEGTVTLGYDPSTFREIVDDKSLDQDFDNYEEMATALLSVCTKTISESEGTDYTSFFYVSNDDGEWQIYNLFIKGLSSASMLSDGEENPLDSMTDEEIEALDEDTLNDYLLYEEELEGDDGEFIPDDTEEVYEDDE